MEETVNKGATVAWPMLLTHRKQIYDKDIAVI